MKENDNNMESFLHEGNARFDFELKRALLEDTPMPDADQAFQDFLANNNLQPRKQRRVLWISITAAIAAASIALLFILSPWKQADFSEDKESQYISLSMGDESIDLRNHEDAKNVGIFITKDHVIQVLDMQKGTAQEKDLTISVPSGQTAKIALPDGTKVELNACSSLSFPHHFDEHSNREVSLIGEAYFNVVHDESHPFLIHAHEFNVRVLGTKFNVRSYPEETHRVVLEEGIVRVEQGNQKVYLKLPSETAIIQHNKLSLTKSDLEQAQSWLHGELYFDGQNLREIMGEIGRWYHYKVVFADANKHDEPLHFSADRTAPIQEIARQLQMIGNAKIEIREKEKVLLVK